MFGSRLAAAMVITAATATPVAAGPLPTPTGTPYFPPTPSTRVTLSGHVAAGPGCAGNRGGMTVMLNDRSTVTGARGRFAFTDVAYGYYYLSFAPDCPLIPCYPGRNLFIDASGDVDLEICRDDCPAAAQISRSSGPEGSLVDVSGRCDAARNESVSIWFDDRQLATITADKNGVYGAGITVPPDAAPDATHRIRAVRDEREIAAGDFVTTYGGPPCVGDCNRDGRVTIDELLRGIRIAMGLDQTNTCYGIDASSNGSVSIAELVTGVERALDGCRLPDLVPLDAHYSRCVEYACSTAEQVTRFMEVCIANQGDADSPGFPVEAVAPAFSYGYAPPLLAGSQECIEMPLVLDPVIQVDPGRDIVEQDESNNILESSIPASTACDVPPPPCTPTPPPTQGPTATPT